MNQGNGRFVEAPSLSGHRARIDFADLDGDGDLDAVIVKRKTIQVHRNDSKHASVHIVLKPRFAITGFMGAKLWVYDAHKKEANDKPKLIHYRQGCTSSDLLCRQHVGIGSAELVTVKVRFPSGAIRKTRAVKAGATVTVRE